MAKNLVNFILGAAIGAGVTYLLTSEKGKEQVQEFAQDVKDLVKEKLDEVKAACEKATSELNVEPEETAE